MNPLIWALFFNGFVLEKFFGIPKSLFPLFFMLTVGLFFYRLLPAQTGAYKR
jgi:hypothetical protein